MAFLIIDNWELFNKEIWSPLEKLQSAPRDLYIELLRNYYISSEIDIAQAEYIEILNNDERAKKAFKDIPRPKDERSCILLLESFYDVMRKFGKSDIAQIYRSKLSEFIERYNIRYLVTEKCKIELSLQGILMSILFRLRKSIGGAGDRMDALEELERSVANISGKHGEKSCIRVSSNLLEGCVGDKAGRKGKTLNEALPGCTQLFPHAALQEAVKNIYDFCSDYPNIRHPGNSQNALRSLKIDDAILLAGVSLIFSSYIISKDDGLKLVLGEF